MVDFFRFQCNCGSIVVECFRFGKEIGRFGVDCGPIVVGLAVSFKENVSKCLYIIVY